MRSIAAAALPLLLATAASNPLAQPSAVDRATVDAEVRSLQVAYLGCERTAAERMLGGDDAANCSAIHERLLKLGFGGDFRRLLAWWQAERAGRAAVRSERIATP